MELIAPLVPAASEKHYDPGNRWDEIFQKLGKNFHE